MATLLFPDVPASNIGSMSMTVKAAGAKRWKGISDKERKQITAKGGKGAWASMSPEERSAEMRRRAKVRAKNRKKAK